MLRANVTGARELESTLAHIASETGKSRADLNKQAMVFALQSATKATSPGAQSKVSTLAAKHKYRPIVGMKSQHAKGEYLYKSDSGKLLGLSSMLSRRSLAKRGFTRVESAFKAWDKKAGSWKLRPYLGNKKSGFDPAAKGGKIPGYGAAKAGWIHALRKLGKSGDTGERQGDYSDVRRGVESLSVTNLVRYVGRTSPRAAEIGVQSAERRMWKSYEKRINQIIRSRAR